MKTPDTTRDRCRVALLLAAVLFIVLGFTFRTLGFHQRELGFGNSLISNDILHEIILGRLLLRGDLRGVHAPGYWQDHSYAGVPLTSLPVMPLLALGERLRWSEDTIWGVAGIPFILCAPLAAWALWRVGRAGPNAPDVALVAIALLLAPVTFEVAVFEARPYFLFAVLDLAAVLALRRSPARSGAWMGLALVAKPNSLTTALVLGAVLLLDAVRTRRPRDLLVWCGVTGAVVFIWYAPFLAVSGTHVLTSLGQLSPSLPLHRRTLPWFILLFQGATSPKHDLYQSLQAHWSPVILTLLQALVALGLMARTRMTRDSPALLAVVAAGHAFIVGVSKTVWIRYGVYPGVLAMAWAVQPTTRHGIRWAFAVLIGQTFIATAVPMEWRTPAWCAGHALLAAVLWWRAWADRPTAGCEPALS